MGVSIRIIVGLLSMLSWAIVLVVFNPLLFRFGDLHNWHGTDNAEWVDVTASVVAAFGLACGFAATLGAARWLFWPCAVLSLFGTFAWSVPAIPSLIRALQYYHATPEPVICGRFFQLWTYVGGAVGLLISAGAYVGLCSSLIWRRKA